MGRWVSISFDPLYALRYTVDQLSAQNSSALPIQTRLRGCCARTWFKTFRSTRILERLTAEYLRERHANLVHAVPLYCCRFICLPLYGFCPVV